MTSKTTNKFDRMVHLPAFLHAEWEGEPDIEQVAQAFALTGFFLQRHVFEWRGCR